jgi:hypothetical protein
MMSAQDAVDVAEGGGWVAGPALLSSEIGTLRFDTAYKDGPVPGYDKYVEIKLKVVYPDIMGFPGPEENDVLVAIEENVQKIAGDQAHFVGSVAARGSKNLLLYARSGDWVGDWESSQRASGDSRQFVVTITDDPGWQSYSRLLPLAEQGYGDVLTFRKLDELALDMAEVRQIDWFLLFPDETGAQAAAAELEERSFDVDLGQALALAKWSVTVHAHDVLHLGLIVRANAMLRQVAARHGGSFDGWGAQVDPDPPAGGAVSSPGAGPR